MQFNSDSKTQQASSNAWSMFRFAGRAASRVLHFKELGIVTLVFAILLLLIAPVLLTGGSNDTEGKEFSTYQQEIWNTLAQQITNPIGVAAVMGCWAQESGLMPNNLQDDVNKKVSGWNYTGYSDTQYANMVNGGEISRTQFIYPNGAPGNYKVDQHYGYGLAQWTTYERKAALYDYCKEHTNPLKIDDAAAQAKFALKEMRETKGSAKNESGTTYATVLAELNNAHTLEEAVAYALCDYEMPGWDVETASTAHSAYYTPRLEKAQQIYAWYTESSMTVVDGDVSGTLNAAENTELMSNTPTCLAMWQKIYAEADGNFKIYAVMSMQCVDFAHWRFWKQYGYDCGDGNGNEMAASTVNKYPDKFKLRTGTPAAGALFSAGNRNHVGFIEKVEGDYLWMSDGNVNHGGIRMNYKWSIKDFLHHYGANTTFAVPIASTDGG